MGQVHIFTTLRRLRIALLAVFLARLAASETTHDWRFWTASDGLTESFVRSIATGPDGRLWIRHGSIGAISVFDGYGMVHIPEVRVANLSNWGTNTRAYGTTAGEAWAVDRGTLQHFQSGTWNKEEHTGPDPVLAAVPASADRVLVLFADRLEAYSPLRHSWTRVADAGHTALGRFQEIVPGFSSDFWITGKDGVARLVMEAGASASAWRWTETSTRGLGLRDWKYPLPAAGGEIFLTGQRSGEDRWVVVRWNGATVERVYQSQHDNLRGWRGPDGEYWIVEGSSLLRQTDQGWQRISRRSVLAGTVNDVQTAADGAFWIGTSEGLARYTVPVWRTPPAVGSFDQPVHSVAEDRQGRLWFSATEYLLELDGATWRRYALPAGSHTHTPQTHGTIVLPDGRIAIEVRGADTGESLIAFDPRTQQFAALPHLQGRPISLLTPRAGGTFWVNTKPAYRFAIWDGRSFLPGLEAPSNWTGSDMRRLIETTDHSVWLGGTSGLAYFRNAVFHTVGAAEGFTDSGAFDLLEEAPGRILAGGRDKLFEFDGRSWTLLKSGLDRVRTIAKLRDGSLWVASGSGLHRRKDGDWSTFVEKDGLPSDTAYLIFEDSRGRLWAGCTTGLSLYHPEADLQTPRSGFAPTGNLRTAGPNGDIRIYFTGIDQWNQTEADRLLFSHRLDDGGWSPFVAESSATFHSLAPGRHQIQLRGMDRNGNMRTAPETFVFDVVLPWYRQSGFVAVMVAAGLAIAMLFGLAVVNFRQRGRLIVDLRRSRLVAETANRQKSLFLANMSHEIRTPLNGIMGMTDLALDLAHSEEQRGYLGTVQMCAGLLLSVLNDILDFSKIEAGKLELENVEFEPDTALRHVVRMLEVRAREKGMRIVTHTMAGVPRHLMGDQHRLQQILFNLLGNAIKFTADGEVRVEVRSSEEPGLLEFIVRDTGIGVPAAKQQSIFAPFEQEDNSTTRKYGGTGLGLAICANLVELMHGRVWVESPWADPHTGQICTGSAFHFTARFGIAGGHAEAAPKIAPTSGKALRIVLAEDHPVNQVVAVRMLERLGHAVLVAGNGREALELVWRERPDLALMDIQMPEMDGLQAASAIREAEKASGGHLPIIALTAHAMRGDSERFREHGIDFYLAKPIRSDELERVLSEAVEAHGASLAG